MKKKEKCKCGKTDGITLEKLYNIFSHDFQPPFINDGSVSVSLSKNQKTLSLTIGPRDVEIDTCGEVIGSGTFIG